MLPRLPPPTYCMNGPKNHAAFAFFMEFSFPLRTLREASCGTPNIWQRFCKKCHIMIHFFHHCMYGSARRKHTRLVHNLPTVCQMELLCDNQHAHEPWGYAQDGWATAEETAYPWPLCRRLATLVALQLQQHGIQCPTPTFATHASKLDALRQQTEWQTSTKGLPWVSEFKTIQHIPASQPIPADARLIGTPAVGYIASAGQKTIGIHRSPQEFMDAALEAKHPGYRSDQLPEPMQEAISFCTAYTRKSTWPPRDLRH